MTDLERFENLLLFVHENEDKVYTLYYDSQKVLAYYDTDYEDDNDLDEESEEYEEYQSIIFKNINNGKLFEFNYHNLPATVMCGKEKVI